MKSIALRRELAQTRESLEEARILYDTVSQELTEKNRTIDRLRAQVTISPITPLLEGAAFRFLNGQLTWRLSFYASGARWCSGPGHLGESPG